MSWLRTLTLPFVASLIALAACAGGNTASRLARAPAFDPKGQSKCGVEKSQANPLIIEWPSADRLQLESKTRQGLVVVRYVGCEMSVLPRCSVAAKYNYVGGTHKQDELNIKDEDDLYANLPIGAAKFEGKLQRSGKLTVKMDLVGRYEAEKSTVRADELVGDCQGATHFISGVTLGAFDFYAGGSADVGGSVGVGGLGAGGHSMAERESLIKDGNAATCEKAAIGDQTPPEGCGALIRIEVVPVGTASCAPAECVDIGFKYQNGTGVTKDEARAVGLYKQGCDGGNFNGCWDLGIMYENGKGVDRDVARGVALYKQACDGGSAGGCNSLGILYDLGKGVTKDVVRAAALFKQACDKGDALGCTNLGHGYAFGEGVPKDEARAVALYKQGCDGGAALGCNNLGWMYENGHSVAVDRAKAMSLYGQACKGRNALGCNNLRGMGESRQVVTGAPAPTNCPAGMAGLPGGSFTMGDRGDPVTVQSFCLDVTEVTVAAYTACAKKGQCSPAPTAVDWPNVSDSDRAKWSPACNGSRVDRSNHPVNCVDWGQAATYCHAVGKRLPTEEEWEWAAGANGSTKVRTYPWGDAAPDFQACWSGVQKRDGTCAVGGSSEGDASGGIHDLAGNVFEWTQTVFNPKYSDRTIRGGSWNSVAAADFRAAGRITYGVAYRHPIVGFRCAR